MADELDLFIPKYTTNSGSGYQLKYKGSDITIKESKIQDFWSSYCAFYKIEIETPGTL